MKWRKRSRKDLKAIIFRFVCFLIISQDKRLGTVWIMSGHCEIPAIVCLRVTCIMSLRRFEGWQIIGNTNLEQGGDYHKFNDYYLTGLTEVRIVTKPLVCDPMNLFFHSSHVLLDWYYISHCLGSWLFALSFILKILPRCNFFIFFWSQYSIWSASVSEIAASIVPHSSWMIFMMSKWDTIA